MSEDKFDEIIKETFLKLENLLIVKGREYRRNNDPFHNFNVGARKTGKIREKVLDGMLLKHEISVEDITNDIENGIIPSIEIVEEKFNDILVFTLIKKASIIDRINKNKKDNL